MSRNALRAPAVVVVCAALAVVGCKKSEAEKEAEPVVAVKVVKVARADVSASVTAPGTVAPKASADVSSKVAAPIASMAILKDKRVRAGETIATLEARDLRASAAEADAAVREAEATLRQTSGGTNPESSAQKEKAVRDAEASERTAAALVSRRQTLFAKGGIPKKELEDAEMQLAQARAELDLARRELQLARVNLNPTNASIAESKLQQARERAANAHAQVDYTVVKSPIDGFVTEQFHQKGDFVSAGEKIVTVADASGVVIKAQFPDTIVGEVEPGADADLRPSTGQEEPMRGTVRFVSRSADPAARTVEVWIDAVNEANRLRPGEFVEVTVVTGEAENAVSVPPAAVTLEDPKGDEGKVVVVDEASVAHEVDVTVGVRGPDAWEITKGLHGGETVVVEGNYALPDGTKVRAVAAEEPEEGEKEKGEADGKEGGDEPGAKDEK